MNFAGTWFASLSLSAAAVSEESFLEVPPLTTKYKTPTFIFVKSIMQAVDLPTVQI